jgi:hypothetical protein
MIAVPFAAKRLKAYEVSGRFLFIAAIGSGNIFVVINTCKKNFLIRV